MHHRSRGTLTGSHMMSAFSGTLTMCSVLFTLKSIIVQRFASTESPSSVNSLSNSSIIANSCTIHRRNVFNLKRDEIMTIWWVSLSSSEKKVPRTQTECKTESYKRGKHSWNELARASQTFARILPECHSTISTTISLFRLTRRCHLF